MWKFWLRAVLLVVILSFPYLYMRELYGSTICSNGGRLHHLFFECDCSHIPWYDDGFDCSMCQIPSSRGTCVFSSTNQYGTAVKCNSDYKWHGPMCDLCNAVEHTATQCRGDCKEFYYGDTCQTYCSANETCNGHGTCQQDGTCLCHGDYYTATTEPCATRCAMRVDSDASGCNHEAHPLNRCNRGSCQCAADYCGPNCGKQARCAENEFSFNSCECQCKKGYERNGTFGECLPIPQTSITVVPSYGFPKKCNDGVETCGEHGRCNVDGESCDCDYPNRNKTLLLWFEQPYNESSCEVYKQSPEALNKRIITAIDEDGIEIMLQMGAEGQLLTDPFVAVPGSYLRSPDDLLYHKRWTAPVPSFGQARELCDNLRDRGCNAIARVAAGAELGFQFQPVFVCDNEDECNDSDGVVYLRTSEDSDLTFEPASCRNRRRDPGNCRRCATHWYPPLPISPQDLSIPVDLACTIHCFDGETSCYGNGRCPAPGEEYTVYPESICICKPGYDPRTRCKSCLPGYRLPEYGCAVYCHDQNSCNQRMSLGLCDMSNTTVTAVLENENGQPHRMVNKTLDRRLCKCHRGMTPESGCQSSCSRCVNGVCGRGTECLCFDGYGGMSCEIACPRHYGLPCNNQQCVARDTYVVEGEMFVNRPCTTDQECGRLPLSVNSSNHEGRFAYCNTTVGVNRCRKVECDCTGSLGGPACNLEGCPSHRFDYNYVPLTGETTRAARTTPCGYSPPDMADQGFGAKTVFCPRGRCVQLTPSGGQGQYDYGTGACVCYPSQAPGDNSSCMSSSEYKYTGASCSGACVCKSKRYGVCTAQQAASVGCTCRTDAYGGHLFGGDDCGKPCPGLCEWNQTALECTPVELGQFAYEVIGRNTSLMNACPYYRNLEVPYHPQCYPDHSGCSRHGLCTGTQCVCHGVYSTIAKLIPDLSVFRVGRVRNMLMASGKDCRQTCPYEKSRRGEFYDLIDWYQDNRDELTRVVTTESARERQISVLSEYVTRYDSLFCSGHGSCTSTAVADQEDEFIACECDDDFAGVRCESKCNREPAINAYFIEQGYSQQYNYVAEYAGRVLKLGVCGVHASCRERLNTPYCAPDGVSRVAVENGHTHYTNATRAYIEQQLTNLVAGANVAQLYDTYGLMFVGPNVECAAVGDTRYYTHEPADERYLENDAVPDILRWHDRRTCNGICMVNAVGQGLIDANNDAIVDAEALNRGTTFAYYVAGDPTAVAVASYSTPRCCQTCLDDDWHGVRQHGTSRYGGCARCQSAFADASTQCATCMYRNFDRNPLAVTTCAHDATAHCSMRQGYVYPFTEPNEALPFPQAVRDIGCVHGSRAAVITNATQAWWDVNTCSCDVEFSGGRCNRADVCHGSKVEDYCVCSATQAGAGCHLAVAAPAAANAAPLMCQTHEVDSQGQKKHTICGGQDAAGRNRGICGTDDRCVCSTGFDPATRCTDLTPAYAALVPVYVCLCMQEALGVVSALDRASACEVLLGVTIDGVPQTDPEPCNSFQLF